MNDTNRQNSLNLEETIDFLRTASEDECNKFIAERIKYIQTYESGVKNLSSWSYFFIPVRILSSPAVYRFALNDNESTIVVTSGPDENYEYKFDDSEVFAKMLVDNIKELDVHDVEGLCVSVIKVVFDYFGSRIPKGTEQERLELIENEMINNPIIEKSGEEEVPYARLSAFKNSKNAWCAERAAVIHQLFKILGVESQIVCSKIETIHNGESREEGHDFNMVRINGKTLVIDATLMNFVGEKDSDGKFISGDFEPFIEVLPFESFDTLQGGCLQNRVSQRSDGTTAKHLLIPEDRCFIHDTTDVYNEKNLCDE